MVGYTRKLYWEDAYAKEFNATVTRVGEGFAVLNQTLFFAAGGGQPGDTGTLNSVRVVGTGCDGEEIVHRLDGGLGKGDAVHGAIDWARRYKIMRLHSAQHLVYFYYRAWDPKLKVTSGRIKPGKADNDYLFSKPVTPEKAAEIGRAVNERIGEGGKIETWTDDDGRRKWRLGEWVMDCGGTHVRDVKEIGRVKLRRGKNAGKGWRRMEVYLED